MREYPYIEIRGKTAFERGIQYGSSARDYIVRARDYYRSVFENRGDRWKDVCRFAAAYRDVISRSFPDLVEEARGIAEGSCLSVEDIMVINCRYEMSKVPQIPECTTGAVLPEASQSGCTYSCKNWDFSSGVMDHLIILHITTEDGTRILGLTEAGQMIRDGFNSHGLSIGTNNLQSVYDHGGWGIPVTFLRRKMLMCRRFEDALFLADRAERTISNNMLLTDGANGRTIDLEWHPKGIDRLDAADGILTHANHFVKQPQIDAITGRPKNRDSRLRQLLMRHHGHITVETIKNCLRDHEYYPLSICGHPDPDGSSYSRDRITVSSMIVDFSNQCAHICAGPPCEGEYKDYYL